MKNNKLATRIFDELNIKGANLGNVSIILINNEIDKHLSKYINIAPQKLAESIFNKLKNVLGNVSITFIKKAIEDFINLKESKTNNTIMSSSANFYNKRRKQISEANLTSGYHDSIDKKEDWKKNIAKILADNSVEKIEDLPIAKQKEIMIKKTNNVISSVVENNKYVKLHKGDKYIADSNVEVLFDFRDTKGKDSSGRPTMNEGSIKESKNMSNEDLIKFIKRYKKYPIGFWYIKYNNDTNKFSVYHIDDPKNSHYDDESGQKCIKFINKEINKSHSKNPFDLSETNENSINASSYLLLTRLQNLDSILSDNKEWIKSVSEALKTCSVNNLEDLSKQYIVTAMKLKDKGEKLANKNESFDDDSIDDELLEFDIPTWALSSLINGDDSGLEDEDIEKINKFCEETSAMYGNANFMLGDESDHESFKHSNDIDNLGSNVTTLYLRPSIKESKLFLTLESFKNVVNEAKNNKIKITYNEVTKNSFTTSEYSILFDGTINGIAYSGNWSPSRGRYVSQGVDINQLKVDGQYVKIFDGGGTSKTYEISANLEKAEKQPKDLRFTGPTLSIKNLKNIFITKIKNAIENPDKEPKLSKAFLKAFNLEPVNEANLFDIKPEDRYKRSMGCVLQDDNITKYHTGYYIMNNGVKNAVVLGNNQGDVTEYAPLDNVEVLLNDKPILVKRRNLIIEAKNNKLWYIGRRDNPQFNKPYYKAYGQLPKSDVKKKEDCAYGSMTLTSYETEEAYNNALDKLKEDGYSIR